MACQCRACQLERDTRVVCPGCGWTGCVDELYSGACPSCGYENNGWDGERLFTLQEMLGKPVEYHDVRLDKFLRSILEVISC